MKHQIIKYIAAILCLMIILMMPAISFAQDNVPTDPDGNVPIDGGLSLLLATGVGYGAKKIATERKKYKTN